MTVLKTGGIVAALAIAGVLIAAATRSDMFRVQRSASNPFKQQDPNLKGSYNGAASGKSAAYTFAGNRSVGKGTIQIIESAPASRVTMTLHMLAPFETRSTVRFLLERQGLGDRWALRRDEGMPRGLLHDRGARPERGDPDRRPDSAGAGRLGRGAADPPDPRDGACDAKGGSEPWRTLMVS